jgi:hypothetical protein
VAQVCSARRSQARRHEIAHDVVHTLLERSKLYASCKYFILHRETLKPKGVQQVASPQAHTATSTPKNDGYSKGSKGGTSGGLHMIRAAAASAAAAKCVYRLCASPSNKLYSLLVLLYSSSKQMCSNCTLHAPAAEKRCSSGY